MEPGSPRGESGLLIGRVLLHYDVEFPPFLDMKRKMQKKSREDEFVRRFELKLVLHTIFTLNYDFVDEDDFPKDQRKRVRNLLCRGSPRRTAKAPVSR